VEEARDFIIAMCKSVSPVTGKRFSIGQILSVAGLSSAAWYDKRPGKATEEKLKPGPKPLFSDIAVIRAVRNYLKDPEF